MNRIAKTFAPLVAVVAAAVACTAVSVALLAPASAQARCLTPPAAASGVAPLQA